MLYREKYKEISGKVIHSLRNTFMNEPSDIETRKMIKITHKKLKLLT